MRTRTSRQRLRGVPHAVWLVATALASVTVFAAPSAAESTAAAGASAGNGVIAFESARDANLYGEIFSAGPGGRARRNLSRSPHHDFGATLSHRRDRVAFASDRAGYPAVYVSGTGGGPVSRVTTRVPTASSVGSLAWSPDDTRIAFSVGLPHPRFGTIEDVYVVNTTGRHQRRLVRGSAPQWSPDGTALVVQEGQNPDNYYLSVIRPDGHRVWRHVGFLPKWSPDGRRIAFWAGQRSLVANPVGNILATLPGGFDSWSPDARQVTYTVSQANSRPLYLADWNGAHAKRIAETGGGQGISTWEANGRRLVFGGTVRGRYGIHLVSVLGGPVRRLPATAIVEWLPTGDLLAYAKDALVLMRPDGRIRSTLVRRPARAEWFHGVGLTRAGHVVYESQAFNETRLFTMRPDGSAVRLFLSDKYARRSPAWSPDGRTVAFSRCTIGYWCNAASLEIYTAAADGTGARRVTVGGSENGKPTADLDTSWSPDGARLVFSRTSVQGTGVYFVGADGSGLTKLADGFGADWSPDGRRIAISRDDGLFVINADGTGLARVVGPTGANPYPVAAYPDWSPDGTQLAFAGSDGIYVVGVDGRGLRRVAAARSSEGHTPNRPDWSPDGTLIAFDDCSRCAEPVNRDIFVVGSDGSGRKRLTSSVGDDGAASWQPLP